MNLIDFVFLLFFVLLLLVVLSLVIVICCVFFFFGVGIFLGVLLLVDYFIG